MAKDKGGPVRERRDPKRPSVMSRSVHVRTSIAGRSAGDAGECGFPLGLDRVLVRAATDPAFRAALLADRRTAVAEAGLRLTDSEATILDAIPVEQLRQTIERVFVPRESRRGFVKAASASVVALLAGEAVWNTAACGGAEGDVPNFPDVQVPGDYEISLGGFGCLLHVPTGHTAGSPTPLCLAFHGTTQANVDFAAFWRPVAEAQRFLVAAVGWTGSADAAAAVAAGMLDSLTNDYDLNLAAPIVAAGFGAGATIALDAALFRDPRFTGAIALSGAAPSDYASRPLADTRTCAFCSVGRADPNHDLVVTQEAFFRGAGLSTHLVELDGGTDIALHDPAAAWSWIRSC